MAMKERLAISSSGWLAILVGLALLAGSIVVFAQVQHHQLSPGPYVAGGMAMIVAAVASTTATAVSGLMADIVHLPVPEVPFIPRAGRTRR